MAGTPEQCPTDAQLVALAAGALEGSELAFARGHLGGCALCGTRLADLGGDGGRTLPSPSWRPGVTPTARGLALPRPIQPGTWIGNYRVDRTVGAGGMGVVYRGVDRSLARAVAIKVLNRPDEDQGRAGDRARLEREWRALARLSHRNVVTIYQVGEHDGRRYLAMEYIEGGTVREWLAAAPRTWREIVDVFAQAGSGLAAVHEAGFIHRDIKPDNLLVGADGRVRLGDFGLVVAAGAGEEGAAALALAGTRRRSARLTDTSALMGTPRYMAPEVLRGEPADARSDQWSFCASVWEALSGAPAYPGDLVTALGRGHEASPPAEPAHPARMPRRLRAPLLRGLSHDPADRWPSMAALNDALAGGRGRLTRAGAIGLGAASAVVLGVVLAVAGDEASGPDPCASVGDEMTVTWNPARRERLAAALGGAPYPEAATRTVDAMLGRYANQWLAARRAACGAARREGVADQAALETACLDERRAALDATVEALVQAPPARPGQALEAAAALPALDDCADATWLASRPGRPGDARRRGEIAALRASLEAARARLALGRADEADRLARAVLERARALAAAPLIGESLRLAGLTARANGAADALPLLEEALTSAEASGDDVLVARAWIDLLDTARLGPVERDVARWLRHAGAIGERLERLHARAHIATRADLASAQGALLATRRMLAPAEDRLREALALELTAGPPGPRLLRARQRLGALLIDRGQRTEGDAELARARLLAREMVGDDERAFPPER